MAWVESHEEIGDHSKTHKLAKLLNCSVPTAVGTVHLLWHYTVRVSWQFGDLSEQPLESIARGCWFNGDPKALLTAFQQSGFLDGMKVHDWEIYAKELIYQRLYNSKRKDKKKNPVNTPVDTCVVKGTTQPNLTKPNPTIPKKREDSASRFAPPTIEQIHEYCLEKAIMIDVNKFHAYYSSNGWKVGRNSMKDWKAAVRNWWARDNKPVDMLTDTQKGNIARFRDWEKRQELKDAKASI